MEAAPGPYGIVGLGLIGGSLALALRRCTGADIVAIEPDAARRQLAESRGWVDQIAPSPEPSLLAACPTIFVCTPVGAFERVLAQLVQAIPQTTLVTDVLAIKGPVLAAVQRLAPRLRFVGGHPMAGGPGGLTAARPDQFVGAPVALCGGTETDRRAVALLWQRLGAKPLEMSTAHHDAAVALTSQLPYLAGIALTEILEPQHTVLIGRGFRRATAPVRFPAEVMADAVAQNVSAAAAAERLAGALNALASLARRGDSAGLQRRAERARAQLLKVLRRR